MPDEDPSAVSEALPAGELYQIPQHVEHPPKLKDKLRRFGPAALTTTELVVVILGPWSKRTAQELVRSCSLTSLSTLTVVDLCKRGGGEVGGLRLAAALELHRRLLAHGRRERPRLTKPAEVYAEVRDIRHHRKEHLIGLYLDAQNQLIHRETLSIGSLNTTRTHPREILFPAIQCLALGFILAHNHPSGGLEPSPEDLEFNRAVQRAGELMGIELYDHLIIAPRGFTSLRERGLL